jgi:hypothetical protein
MKAKKIFVSVFMMAFATLIGIAAVCTTVVVTEEDIARQLENTLPTCNWVLYTRNAGNGAFRTGPATPPAGIGSFETFTPTGADKATLFNFDHIGTTLASIDQISYATYRTSGGSPNQVPALNIQVDLDGNTATTGDFTTLVFEPVYNTGQGVIQDGVWQTWDAYSGGNAIWWSTRNIPGACASDCFVTWDTIVAANPNAIIVGGFGINQGSGNPALTAASDALTLGYSGECITYNFEPYRVAQTKEDCKLGSWQSVKRADGSSFKNQGQCIQYVNTGK